MATAFGTAATASAASSVAAKNAPKSSANLPLCHRHFHHSHSKVFFRVSPKPKLRFFSNKGWQSNWNRSALVRAQSNEVNFFQLFSLEELFSNFSSFLDTLLEPSIAFKVAVDGSSKAAVNAPAKSTEVRDLKPSSEPAPLASEESISEFMTQVAGLVKLVDSKDIVELQLKQLDCELLIRKKEALPLPPSPAPIMMAQPHYPPPAAPAPVSMPVPAPAPAPAAAPAAKSAKSSLPALKCPMAGTFYRKPGPGEPPFVKVGDKVKKGQVLCIIEAMKLMNEIEADQSGTIVDVLVEDGKPVSVDTPLFVIEPQ